MLVHEESQVLRYLQQHATVAFAEVLRACLPGVSLEWGQRLLANLEWLGYITIYSAGDGEPLAVQITDKGRSYFGGGTGVRPAAGGLAMP